MSTPGAKKSSPHIRIKLPKKPTGSIDLKKSEEPVSPFTPPPDRAASDPAPPAAATVANSSPEGTEAPNTNDTPDKTSDFPDSSLEGNANEPAEKNAVTGRFASSLGVLARRFVSIVASSPSRQVDLNDIKDQLGVPKRRLYDITCVLEGIGMIEKRSKNTVVFRGKEAARVSIEEAGNDKERSDGDLNDEERPSKRKKYETSDMGKVLALTTEMENLNKEESLLDFWIFACRKLPHYQRSDLHCNADDIAAAFHQDKHQEKQTVLAIRGPPDAIMETYDPVKSHLNPKKRSYQLSVTSKGAIGMSKGQKRRSIADGTRLDLGLSNGVGGTCGNPIEVLLVTTGSTGSISSSATSKTYGGKNSNAMEIEKEPQAEPKDREEKSKAFETKPITEASKAEEASEIKPEETTKNEATVGLAAQTALAVLEREIKEPKIDFGTSVRIKTLSPVGVIVTPEMIMSGKYEYKKGDFIFCLQDDEGPSTFF